MLLLAPCGHLHALGTGKPLQEYGHQTWQSDTGLPQNTVRAIVQTREGYLWIGTEAGLVRYDGVEFRVFDESNTPALHSGFISSLKEDASGALWISTPAGLACERAGAFTSYRLAEGLPSATVFSSYLARDGRLLALTAAGAAELRRGRFYLIPGTNRLGLTDAASMVSEDARGRIWIAGPASVLSFDPESGHESGAARNAPPGAPLAGARIDSQIETQIGQLQALATTPTGDLWAGGSRGIVIDHSGQRARLEARDSLPSNDVTSLLATADGGMWIGTGKGLALYSPATGNGAGAATIRPQAALAGMRVQSLFQDRAGTLWVATTDGIARVSHGIVDVATRRHGLAGVLSIFEDREGSMWFGTDTAGLHVLREQAFSTVSTEDGLSASLVRAVFEDHAGTLWIGTSGGGLDRMQGNAVAPFPGPLPSKVILALAETQQGSDYNLWVGTPEGLVRLTQKPGGQPRVFTTADGLADDFVRSLYADQDGSLWVGTRNGLSHLESGTFHSYSRLDGLASDLVGAILRRRSGELLIGTLGGLSRMAGDSFVDALPKENPDQADVAPFSTQAAAPVAAVTALLEDSEGTLWLGGNGTGLSCLRAGRLTRFPPASTGTPATIYGMLEDGSGHLWLSSRKGVDRISIAALHAYAAKHQGDLAITHYGTADGMRISEASGGGHPAAWRARDGALWFATLDGASVVHPAAGLRNLVSPNTVIEQLLIDDQPVAVPSTKARGGAGPVHVAPGRGRLTIQYAGLSFVAPQKVRYRYRLENFDKGWVDAGSRRTAYYTNVPPGSYRFLVAAANNDGVWGLAPAEIPFDVEPYFYQTKWFYALVAAMVLGLGTLVYRWRVHTVEAQYQAVLGERGRIAREIHDTLAQGYVAIAMQLELAERLLANSTEAALQQLKQTRELVRESLAEARSSIWNLRAQSDAGTLPSQMAAHCTLLSRRQAAGRGAAVKFTVHGTYRPLARTVEDEVRRIAQEAAANAVAHAQANLITVTLSYDALLLVLRVTDDGVGMSPSAQGQSGQDRSAQDQSAADHSLRGHFGLQGMRERAARIHALIDIDSAPAHGTTITLQVDLRRAARKDRPFERES